ERLDDVAPLARGALQLPRIAHAPDATGCSLALDAEAAAEGAAVVHQVGAQDGHGLQCTRRGPWSAMIVAGAAEDAGPAGRARPEGAHRAGPERERGQGALARGGGSTPVGPGADDGRAAAPVPA